MGEICFREYCKYIYEIKIAIYITGINKGLDVTIKGDPHCVITGVCPIQQAESGHITFLTNSLIENIFQKHQAAAVILSEADAEPFNECRD